MRPDLARVILAGLIVGASSSAATHAAVGDFAYVSPLPGSRYVSPGNNVAIRPGAGLDPSSVVPGLVTVTGDKSGAHAGLEYTFHVSGVDGRTFSRAAFEAELSAPPPP